MEQSTNSSDSSQVNPRPYVVGEAPIKQEYLVPKKQKSHSIKQSVPDDDAAESKTNHIVQNGSSSGSIRDGDQDGEPEAKRVKIDSDPNSNHDAQPKQKLSGAARKKAAKQAAADAKMESKGAGKHKGGQNHGRKFKRLNDVVDLCSKVILGQPCSFGDSCRYSHDISLYLSSKPPDIEFPRPPPGRDGSLQSTTPTERQQYLDLNYISSKPFYRFNREQDASNSDFPPLPVDDDPSASKSERHNCNCPAFLERGFCNASYRCRFLSSHSRVVKKEGENGAHNLELSKKEGEAAKGEIDRRIVPDERNLPRAESIKMLQKKNANLYPFNLSDAVLSILDEEPTEFAPDSKSRPKGRLPIDFERLKKEGEIKYAESLEKLKDKGRGGGKGKGKEMKDENGSKMDLDELEERMMNQNSGSTSDPTSSTPIETKPLDPSSRSLEDSTTASSIDVARIRLPEKRRLDWKDKLYLAPLTTTGNLPFRRICTSFGSDIHCGEMGLAESFLSASKSEWSLVKRHSTEKIFGTQVCGSKPKLLIPTAELLMREIGDGLDFVDINCGCPIDLVYNKGSGSALLDHPIKLSKIVRGMSTVLGEIPITVKLRTGTTSKNTAHNLFPRLQTEFGVGAATLHGRSRKQRYKNNADWNYIKTCTDSLRSSLLTQNEESSFADQEEMSPIPIFGNGDVYSWQDYYENKEMTGVDGEMIARGGLIKPWLFTEIKERRDWDISSRERLDIFRQFSSYGLSHWGTDTIGVNTTRRFLCEAMSFTHRYIPIGILETLPSRLNDRPPPYKGRDELETLLASSNVSDWIKLSEMFLGKSPPDFKFLPKHKSSSYEKDGDEKGGEDQG